MLAKYKLRFQEKVAPAARILLNIGFTPNALTSLGFLFSLVTSYFILDGNFLIASFYMGVTLLLDGLDGVAARLHGTTKFGDFYDAFIDRVVEIIFYVSIIIAFPELLSRAFLALILSLIISYIAARSEVWTIGVRIRYDSIGSRAERLLVLLLGLMFMHLRFALEIIILITTLGIIQRLLTVYRELH